jgi:hypothetical protein
MNERPETEPERRIPRTLLIWLFLFTAIVFVQLAGLVVHMVMYPHDEHLFSLSAFVVKFFIVGVVGASILLCLWLFMRWLCCWRNLRHALIGVAILATLAAIFYTEEDWRGKRAWENCKRDLEAKGAVLDWDKYIPPPVPDDQNFFKAPKMEEWFVKNPNATTNELMMLVTNADKTATITDKVAAGNFLAWSDQFQPDFDLMREALKRPCAVIPGNYSKPYEQPIPNFVTMRALAQTLAQRAQCFLLLNRPEAALHELTLMHDVCRILEKPPTGQPETLVEAMINVAITGLYIATVQEGFRMHAWQAPQLAAIQAQLTEINLPPWIAAAFQAEQAATCHAAELVQPSQISMIGLASTKPTIWKKIMDLPNHAIDLAPRGWVYQNMAVCARVIQIQKENVLDTNQNVIPRRTELAANEIAKTLDNHYSPFYLLARIAVPNFTKAMQACAFNQTLANQAQIVCALERHHLAHGEYPEILDALVPQFIEKIPHDIIGGQWLHYRRTENGKFLLYSIGWNETDDGGQVALKKDGSEDREQGDWVWTYPQK